MEKHRLPQLKKLELFSTLMDDELERVGNFVSIRTYKKNMLILNEADTNEFMYGVMEGEVKAFKISEDGRETILALRGTGKTFGELSMIDGKTTPAAVTATEDSVVAVISKTDFYELIHREHKVLNRLLDNLCSQVRESLKMQELMNLKNASERIRMLFLTVAEERGHKTSEGTTLNVKLTHQRIADMTGLTRESVTRALDKWKKDNLISLDENKRIILSNRFTNSQ